MPKGVYERKSRMKAETARSGSMPLLLPQRATSIAEEWAALELEIGYFNLESFRMLPGDHSFGLKHLAHMEEDVETNYLPHFYGDNTRRHITLMRIRKEAIQKAIQHFEDAARHIDESQRGIMHAPPMKKG